MLTDTGSQGSSYQGMSLLGCSLEAGNRVKPGAGVSPGPHGMKLEAASGGSDTAGVKHRRWGPGLLGYKECKGASGTLSITQKMATPE